MLRENPLEALTLDDVFAGLCVGSRLGNFLCRRAHTQRLQSSADTEGPLRELSSSIPEIVVDWSFTYVSERLGYRNSTTAKRALQNQLNAGVQSGKFLETLTTNAPNLLGIVVATAEIEATEPELTHSAFPTSVPTSAPTVTPPFLVKYREYVIGFGVAIFVMCVVSGSAYFAIRFCYVMRKKAVEENNAEMLENLEAIAEQARLDAIELRNQKLKAIRQLSRHGVVKNTDGKFSCPFP